MISVHSPLQQRRGSKRGRAGCRCRPAEVRLRPIAAGGQVWMLSVEWAQNTMGPTIEYMRVVPAGDVPMDKDKKAFY